MSPQDQSSRSTSGSSAIKAWVRALERTAPIGRDPQATFPLLIHRLAERFELAPALVGQDESLSYGGLSARSAQYARWAIAERFSPGETVCLLLGNCPDYVAIWLGLTRARLSVALLNTNLTGQSLAHSIRVVAPRAIIAGAGFTGRLKAIRGQLDPGVTCWSHGIDDQPLPRVDQAVKHFPSEPVDSGERAPPVLSDRALFIYTSGTTGLPKAAVVTHLRLIRWAQWFSGMMDMTSADRMYDCLPLYHSVGGVVATGATLTAGGTVIIREKFSASRFWQDLIENQCTVFQYIGELCRYLLAHPSQEAERAHGLRLACGNGLQREVWTAFQERFRVPQILEYYASTEGNVSLYNCEGKPGSVGRIPPFLSHRYPIAVVKSDPDTGEPLRDSRGHCIRCAANEAGEVLGQIVDGPEHAGTRFEGYSDMESTQRKVLRDAFQHGDHWYRTGDLMTRDTQGFFYFADRVGDTFRWHGENVSTSEVTQILAQCTGVIDVAVYGVRVPGTEGRVGMSAMVVDSLFDLSVFRRETAERLPPYARPLFLRLVPSLSRTGTFKLQKTLLVSEGFDPAHIADALYFDHAQQGQYVPLDASLYAKLQSGIERI